MTHEEELQMGDLAMIVRMLVHRLRKHQVGEDLCERSMAYLTRKNLQGSPLRNVVLPLESE
jgi:hypothetical protein